MVNLGVDFGSTYTMVSVFRDGKPQTVQPDNLTFHYPSIVVYDKKKQKYFYGTSARNKLGAPGIVPFRGFKMLLNSRMSAEQLRARNYDEVNTPESITERFLKYVVDNTLKKLEEDKVGTLVLGAPECWFQSIETVDSRGVLRDICCRMKDKIEDVRIVSEPTNAAAYSVWCYEKERKKQFEGNVLVVDYGGGTLDTAVVSVRHKDNERLMIRPEMRSGRGENLDNEIGSAGIAYQEAVVKKAIRDALDIHNAEIHYGADFDKAVKYLENILVTDAENVEETFEDNLTSLSALKTEELLTFDYDDQEITITYGQLKEVYDETIAPILAKVLEETTEDIARNDQVYVSLVGGFCNYYLVRKQVTDYFNHFFGWGSIGAKEKIMRLREDEREKAIAHGASLFADDILDVCYVAQFGIGMYSYLPNGSTYKQYAISYGQEYVPDQIYFSRDDDGEIAVMMLTKLDTFLINFDRNRDAHMPPMKPKKEFANRLNAVKCGYMVVVGFSIDARERIKVHIYEYNNDPQHRGPGEQPVASIPLKTFRESFENTVIHAG